MYRIILVMLCTLAVPGLSRAALVIDVGGSGAFCSAGTPNDATLILYASGAVWNADSTRTATVICGGVRLSTGSPANLLVNYWDSTSVGLISCTASVSSWDGGQKLWSQTKSSTTSGTGADQGFLFQPPQNTLGYVAVECTLPPTQLHGGQPGRSGIRNFTMQ